LFAGKDDVTAPLGAVSILSASASVSVGLGAAASFGL
jgi:hypothetical protein